MFYKIISEKPYRKTTWKNLFWLFCVVIPFGVFYGLAIFIILKFSKDNKEETNLERNYKKLLKRDDSRTK